MISFDTNILLPAVVASAKEHARAARLWLRGSEEGG